MSANYEFSHLSLDDLNIMLRDTLRDPAPTDKNFIKALANEIADRQKQIARETKP